ncbi:DUF4843 domain-containing protein [Pedobacter steynii]|nr:DUF4843 domain-containing protein [Pedobacter steynii]
MKIRTIKYKAPHTLMLCLLLSLISCKKKDLLYQELPGIYINKELMTGSRDSVSYSFAEKENNRLLDTIFIPVRVSGAPASVNRTVPLVVNPTTSTAISGQHYTILNTVVDAGAYTARVPVVLKRTADLKNNQVRIYLKIDANNEFPQLITNTKTPNTTNGNPLNIYTNVFLIKLSDQILKPDTWDLSGSWFKYFFGAYSAVKFKFIIDVTGRSVWPPYARYGENAPTSSQMDIYYSKMVTALYEYEVKNGPMLDENGNQVTFPKL